MPTPITGFLYSQIGYDLGQPKQAIVRHTQRRFLSRQAAFALVNQADEVVHQGAVRYWGKTWGAHWWTLDFSAHDIAGMYRLIISDQGEEIWRSDDIEIAEDLLWNQTIHAVAIEQLDERARRARNNRGWMDCGAPLREVNSHASMILGLTDLLEQGFEGLDDDQQARIVGHILRGLDYIATCQDKAADLGLGKGAIIHEIPSCLYVLPADVMQCAVAFARASRLLFEWERAKSIEYLARAERAFRWIKTAHPYGPQGFDPRPHGAPVGYTPPMQWMTRELTMQLWAALELFKAGKQVYKEDALGLARQILRRQVPESQAEGGVFGHFYAYDDHAFTEKAWTHHDFGHDTGGVFPHYLLPLIEMARTWGDHPDAADWRQAIHQFAYGYLLPACQSNPFALLPLGFFAGEGLLSFAGLWHGMNASYGFGAALAAELEWFLGDFAFRRIAVGNLQWIAGLNAGITQASLKGSLHPQVVIAPGAAEPYSMIYGIGRQSTGSWTNIRGTICNGFDADEQFRFVQPATAANDAPHMFTDEDWITHAGGWLAGLTRLRHLSQWHAMDL
jgi:hypothetical protein